MSVAGYQRFTKLLTFFVARLKSNQPSLLPAFLGFSKRDPLLDFVTEIAVNPFLMRIRLVIWTQLFDTYRIRQISSVLLIVIDYHLFILKFSQLI